MLQSSSPMPFPPVIVRLFKLTVAVSMSKTPPVLSALMVKLGDPWPVMFRSEVMVGNELVSVIVLAFSAGNSTGSKVMVSALTPATQLLIPALLELAEKIAWRNVQVPIVPASPPVLTLIGAALAGTNKAWPIATAKQVRENEFNGA